MLRFIEIRRSLHLLSFISRLPIYFYFYFPLSLLSVHMLFLSQSINSIIPAVLKVFLKTDFSLGYTSYFLHLLMCSNC